jgi:hypothetical protein
MHGCEKLKFRSHNKQQQNMHLGLSLGIKRHLDRDKTATRKYAQASSTRVQQTSANRNLVNFWFEVFAVFHLHRVYRPQELAFVYPRFLFFTWKKSATPESSDPYVLWNKATATSKTSFLVSRLPLQRFFLSHFLTTVCCSIVSCRIVIFFFDPLY